MVRKSEVRDPGGRPGCGFGSAGTMDRELAAVGMGAPAPRAEVAKASSCSIFTARVRDGVRRSPVRGHAKRIRALLGEQCGRLAKLVGDSFVDGLHGQARESAPGSLGSPLGRDSR